MKTFFNGRLILTLFLAAVCTACDMEQEIEVKLPKIPAQLVVECYLENGKPIKMALSESTGYFDNVQPTIVDDATVLITKNNEAPIKLTFRLQVDEENRKAYNYHNPVLIDAKPGDVYTLEITDPRGRRVTGSTKILPPVPFDSVGYKFNDKPDNVKEAYLYVRWQDDPAAENFYRLLAHQKDTSTVDNTNSRMDAEITDRLRNGQKITYTTTYRFKKDDTLNLKLYHVDQAYYRFISSTEDARRSNGNPFAQPVAIQNTVVGGYGVFTHLNYVTKELILK
ncbi:DUF4249 domain-containing protein [Rufibacter sp. LB8]|uniref:DUF4249 domain-containing protein n=1 Tax=Rufibacter sp. LB8 TaxID=2777781 RepID=UPI00178C5CA5|nr:DUF4249 domain-containing protein [Rufibacter sp. LB8]